METSIPLIWLRTIAELRLSKKIIIHYLEAIEVSVGVNNIAIQTPGDLPTGLTEEDDKNENLGENTDDEDKN